jgi:hypothetical protein
MNISFTFGGMIFLETLCVFLDNHKTTDKKTILRTSQYEIHSVLALLFISTSKEEVSTF